VTLSYKDVADIIKIVDASSCDEVIIELGDTKIVVRRSGSPPEPVSRPREASTQQPAAQQLSSQARAPGADRPRSVTETTSDRTIIRSPMVGTFYRAPSPNEPAFVEVGRRVKSGDALCIIEVMKLFTTISAERAGTITAIFAENGTLVEFDQPLFEIDPA